MTPPRRSPLLAAPALALALGLALAPASASPARASEPLARRIPLDASQRVGGLKWPESDALEVESEPFGDGDYKTYVILAGTFAREGWTLLWSGDKLIHVDDRGAFSLRAPVEADSVKVKIRSVGPMGEIEEDPVGISFPTYSDYRKELKDQPPKISYLSGGLSFTSISYTETSTPDYSSISLTGKLNYQRLIFPPNWDFSVTAYLTLLPLTRNVDATARFLGLNARVGYVFPQIQQPWRVSLMGGAYYTTMLVSNNQFGFRNLAGPQLYPTVRRSFRRGDAVAGYFKFSPISDGIQVLALSNSELALGVSYSRPLHNGHALTVSADIASLQLLFSGIQIRSNTLSLGASYGF